MRIAEELISMGDKNFVEAIKNAVTNNNVEFIKFYNSKINQNNVSLIMTLANKEIYENYIKKLNLPFEKILKGALMSGRLSFVKYILDNQKFPEKLDLNYCLLDSLKSGNCNIAEFLIDHGADVNTIDHPLQFCAYYPMRDLEFLFYLNGARTDLGLSVTKFIFNSKLNFFIEFFSI